MRWPTVIGRLLPLVLVLGCAGAPPAAPKTDHAMRLATVEVQLKARPTGLGEAQLFLREVTAAYAQGAVQRGELNGPEYLKRADAVVAIVAAAHPEQAPALWMAQGRLLAAAHRPEQALAKYEASFNASPNVDALEAILHIKEPPFAAVRALCRQTLQHTHLQAERYGVLRNCLKSLRARTLDEGLAWASPDDRIFYRRESARRGISPDALLSR